MNWKDEKQSKWTREEAGKFIYTILVDFTYTCKAERDRHREEMYGYQREGETDWEIGVGIYTTMYNWWELIAQRGELCSALCGDLHEVAQSCLTLCDPMGCSLPGSSVHGIFQARVLEWVAISFSRGSSQPKGQTRVSRTTGRRLTVWASREALNR